MWPGSPEYNFMEARGKWIMKERWTDVPDWLYLYSRLWRLLHLRELLQTGRMKLSLLKMSDLRTCTSRRNGVIVGTQRPRLLAWREHSATAVPQISAGEGKPGCQLTSPCHQDHSAHGPAAVWPGGAAGWSHTACPPWGLSPQNQTLSHGHYVWPNISSFCAPPTAPSTIPCTPPLSFIPQFCSSNAQSNHPGHSLLSRNKCGSILLATTSPQ